MLVTGNNLRNLVKEAKMFAGKNVVITGAGRGIGRSLALAFAEQGAQVLVHCGHAAKEASDVVGQIVDSGGRAKFIQADLTQSAEAQRLVAEAPRLLGSVDI